MRGLSIATALVGAAAIISTYGVDAACAPFTLVTLPSTLGIDRCIGNNQNAILSSLLAPGSKCSLTQVLGLTSSTSLTRTIDLLTRILATPEELSSIFYDHMTTTSDAQMDAFCSDLGTLISPCVETLLPVLMAKANTDTECCGELSDVLDLLSLVVPPTISKESFVLSDVLNGVNQFFCAKRQDTKQTCGASVYRQLTTKYTSTNFRLFESFLLPFVSASAGQECNAFQGQAYTSSLSLASMTAIDYSCCVDYMRPLMESVQAGFEYVLSNSALEFLNGMMEFSDASTKFVDALKNAKGACTYKTTCTAPVGLTAYSPRTITPGTNNPNKNALQDTVCTKVKKCDAKGTTCSDVCAKGSVVVPTWVSQALKYQRKLAYAGSLCYAQLPATHNSAINLADGYGNRDQLMNLNLSPSKPYSFMKTNNHVLSVVDQLTMGVRWLEIDVHYFLKSLRTAHCGNLGSNSIQVLAQMFQEQLSKYGTVRWNADLLGCFPSLSGIRAEEQWTTRESMEEIRSWLDKPENKDELVVVYMDTGSELSTFGKVSELNALLTDVFGELIVPMSEWEALQAVGWSGSSATAQRFIDQGHRVVLLANDNTGLAFRMRDFCKGHQVLSTEFINAVPDASRVLGGKKIYSGDYFMRSYQSNLRYISLGEAGTITRTLPVTFNAGNVYNYVRWSVNLVATDGLDASMLKPQVWSWAENEPSVALSNATVVVTSSSGQWRALSSSSAAASDVKWKACWNSASLQWLLVDVGASCATGFSFVGPSDPYQNYLLQQAIIALKVPDSVAINVR